jgi:DNA topoisomerase I
VAADAAPPAESIASAREAGLRWVSDDMPGIRRRKAGRGFFYVGPDGERVRDERVLRRIHSIVIPPAWTDVWICPFENGHIQATGRDARRRKQYRYHSRWRAVRDEAKYEHVIDFARALPRIRRRVTRDLGRRGLPREKVLATVVRLLETTTLRVGNREYAEQNNSFGLTTLTDEHVKVKGDGIRFRFRGKAGKNIETGVRDRRLARIIKRCEELPGQRLFQYVGEDGALHAIDSSDVNDYLRKISGGDFTAKDVRTWVGTVLAARALQEMRAFDSATEAKRNVVAAIERVAERLGNTRQVCRTCYVHPAIVDSYLTGSLASELEARAEEEMRRSLHRMSAEEAAVLALLQRRLLREAKVAG